MDNPREQDVPGQNTEKQSVPGQNATREQSGSIFNEPEPKKKSHKLLITLIIIFVALLGVAGSTGVWWWQQNEMKKQKSESDARVTELQGQKNESDKTAKDLQTDVNALNKKLKSANQAQAANPYLYVNNQEGFQLTFPSSWVQYGVSESLSDDKKSKYIYFGLPLKKPDKIYDFGFDRNYANLFAISIMDKETWEANKNGPDGGQKIAAVGDKVYTYSTGNGVPPALASGSAAQANKEISSIIKSFKLLK